MSAWGPGIFEDKEAIDVRDQFEEHLDLDLKVDRITDILIDKWGIDPEDEEDGTVFWLALAAVQLEYEVLEERVKERALIIIEEDIDIELFWYDSENIEERKDELEELKQKLLKY